MLHFAILWAGLLFVGVALFPFSVGLYPIPAAVCVARHRWGKTAGILLAAALTPPIGILLRWLVVSHTGGSAAAEISLHDLAGYAAGSTLEYVAFGLAGVMAGAGMARLWPYGRLVHIVTGYVFILMAINFVTTWDAWSSQVNAMFDNLRVAIHDQATQAGTDVVQEQLDALTWLQDHAGSFIFGANYATILVVTCVFVSLTAFILRGRYGQAGPSGSFAEMRPSEWLVWLAILAALLCIAYQRWPLPQIGFIGWNSALGLSAVYCLNGLSIFLYGVRAFRPNLIIFVLIVVVVVNVGAIPILMLLGLFDTWGDYRRKIDKLVAARQARDRSDDNEV